MPEDDVLQGRHRVAANQPGEPAEPLALMRIALMWHRGRTLVTGVERLLQLADLCPGEMADLDGELVDRRRQDR